MASPTAHQPRTLRLLCLHGHGGFGERLCGMLERGPFMVAASGGGLAARSDSATETEAVMAQCRCIDAPFSEPSRRRAGRQWWRYENNQTGDRPEDWAEMEVAATRIAEELEAPAEPYDGLLGFSQGAEMVHTAAVLAHRGDPRFVGPRAPRFGVSLSGGVNPGHFEAIGGGGPPQGVPGPCAGPGPTDLGFPMLFVGDFSTDNWYPAQRFHSTREMYQDVTVVRHEAGHKVPSFEQLSAGGIAVVQAFFQRFASN